MELLQAFAYKHGKGGGISSISSGEEKKEPKK